MFSQLIHDCMYDILHHYYKNSAPELPSISWAGQPWQAPLNFNDLRSDEKYLILKWSRNEDFRTADLPHEKTDISKHAFEQS